MLFPQTSPAALAQKFCVNFDPSDPLMDLYQQAATQFNSDNDPSLAAWIVISLMSRRMLYNKSSCTDCSGPTNLAGAENTEVGIDTGLSALNSGLADAESFAQAGSALATGLASAIPVVGQITNIITSIVGVFGKAHAAAVAREQQTNCAVTTQFNQYIGQLDQAVASGQVSADAGIQTAQQIIDTISANVDPVVSGRNAGWGLQQVLAAQLWFRQQWYPMIEGGAGGLGSISASLGLSPKILLVGVLAVVLLMANRRKSV